MNDKLENAVQALQEQFGGERLEFRGEITLMLASKDIPAACQLLRDQYGFNLLGSLTASDYWPEGEPRFYLSYQLHNIDAGISLRLRVSLPGEAPAISTIETIFHNANWYERELFDMFGIQFEGHSDLRRILMPYDWQGHPLRKDYPLGYEEPQFTFNYDEIQARKPTATE